VRGLKKIQVDRDNQKENKMKNKKLLLFVNGLLMISMTTVACTPTAPTMAPTKVPTAILQPTAAPTEPAVKFPTGKFIKSGTTNYGLVFNEDGTFSVFDRQSMFVNGTYSVDGDIYTEESNDHSCPPMSFKYMFDGTNLTFNYVGNPAADPCGGRRTDFDNQTYILSK
jgi:hypothetical protein